MSKTIIRAPRRKVVTDDDRVRVVVRVRPPNVTSATPTTSTKNNNNNSNSNSVAFAYDEQTGSADGDLFDCVLGPTAPQRAAFSQVLPIVEMWLTGFNGTIFAYGQTGSGKTHTMLGRDGGKHELDGVIPNVVAFALKRLEQEKADRAQCVTSVAWNARLQASYVELYNDGLRDLIPGDSNNLADVIDGGPQVREDEFGNVFLAGATKTTVQSPEELLQVVRLGATRRAMGRTNMNEFSSRSHAVLSLYLECRWKDTATQAGHVRSSISTLQLVDLAGSEYAKKTGNVGDRMKESIAINTGLFALGNVIAALSGHRDRRVGNHIPYRDSLLTRLLQSALGGDARTALIVCVSPEMDNLAETRSSLQYAASARRITNTSKQHVAEVEEEIEGPYKLSGDMADPNPESDRRSMWVETQYGDVFCRVLGKLSGDVLLFVHGSGPTNSGCYWNSIIWETYCRVPDRNYCYVAMDCPGYGRSRGDRQHIRSNPGDLIRSVLYGLGKRNALCLIGSSQGACAVFNAVLESPKICRRLAVVHPVGHDPARYTAIKQPTLLTFDVEDMGHPVSVGRIMKRNIPFTIYHEYQCSKTPNWESDHTAGELIKLLDWDPAGCAFPSTTTTTNSTTNNRPTIEAQSGSLWSLAGGIVSWVESNGPGNECGDLYLDFIRKPSLFLQKEVAEAGDLDLMGTAESSSTLTSDFDGSVWNAYIDKDKQRIFYVNSISGEKNWKRPEKGRVIPVGGGGGDDEENDDESNKKKSATGAAAAADDGRGGNGDLDGPQQQQNKKVQQQETVKLFDSDDDEDDDSDNEPTEEEIQKRMSAEMQQTICSCCSGPLWRPQRGRTCRHVVCGWCYTARGQVTKTCPTCRISPYEKVDAETMAVHQQILEQQQNNNNNNNPVAAPAGESMVDAAIALRNSLAKITIEFGNTAEGSAGASFIVCASIKATKVERGTPKNTAATIGNVSATSVISKVGFDINPSFPKSAVKVTSPPFKLERDMSTPFTCAMQVSFSVPCLNWLTLVIPYGIHHVKNHRERIVVYVVPPGMRIPEVLMKSQQQQSGEGPQANSSAAIVQQVQPKQVAPRGRAQLPVGWFRLPDVDYNQCDVSEVFVLLK